MLPNVALVQLVNRLNQNKRLLDAELLLCLSEFDLRKLYREAACSSFFEYLTRRLGYSEDVAYRRMWCARLLREYPLVYDLLCSGQIHLAALLLLKPHLTPDNHRELLMAAVGKSKREVEKLVAARSPKPDAPTQIRRIPEPAVSAMSASPVEPPDASPPDASTPVASPVALLSGEPQATAPSITVSRRTKIEPSSASSYRVAFTASERLKQKLSRASELTSHLIPPTDLPALLERALDLLIEREEYRRFGSKRSRRQQGESNDTGSSYIPAAVRREVWERDDGQCTYVSAQGERCQCRHHVQFDHRIARALGGPSTVENLRLRCAAHNALAAEQVLGIERVKTAIACAHQRRRRGRDCASPPAKSTVD